MHMKPIMEGWRGYLKEQGQKGTVFEDVIVAMANGEPTGDNGKIKFNPKKANTWKGYTYDDLANVCLGYIPNLQRGPGTASKVSGAGTGGGDPKTDVIINGMKISVKLPGDIQFTSGELKSSADALVYALDEYLKQPQNQLKQGVLPVLANAQKQAIDDFVEAMQPAIDKRFYPEMPNARAQWKRYLKEGERGYLAMIAARAQWDWNRGAFPSAGIPKAWKDESERQIGKVSPRGAYPRLQDYIDAYTNLALEYIDTSKLSTEPYEKIAATLLSDLKKKIKAISRIDPEYYYLILDEWMTGRRQLSGNHVADWLLSPDGLFDISSIAKTKALAIKWEDYISWDVRSKGREFLGKAIAPRIGFDQEKYYKTMATAWRKHMSTVRSSATGPHSKLPPAQLPEAQSPESTTETDAIAQEVAKELISDIEFGFDASAAEEIMADSGGGDKS